MLLRLRSSTSLYFLRSIMSTSNGSGPVEASIRQKLTALLRPTALTISNDSWQHRHHAAMREAQGGDGETPELTSWTLDFSVTVVSEEFKGKTNMQRHRMIYAALADELSQGLHALSLKTKTPEEEGGQVDKQPTVS